MLRHSLPATATALLLSLSISTALAQSKAATAAEKIAGTELIPRDLLFGNPERSSVLISPDGQTLSWLAPVDGVMNVWVAPANDPSQAKSVTAD